MYKRLNAQQKRELEEHNRACRAAHPDYYKTDYESDPESDHSAEIAAAKRGKRIYQEMNY